MSLWILKWEKRKGLILQKMPSTIVENKSVWTGLTVISELFLSQPYVLFSDQLFSRLAWIFSKILPLKEIFSSNLFMQPATAS